VISLDARKRILALVSDAILAGARKAKAADVVGISLRQLQRWQAHPEKGDGRKGSSRRVAHALTQEEKGAILKIANSPDFCNLSPHKIVPMLADRGIYLASERTFYRVLDEHSCLGHRHKSKPPAFRKRPQLRATGPGQVWSWDISYLKSTIRGRFFYLYVFMDIFSRKIVGWDVQAAESSELAAKVLRAACLQEGVNRNDLILHSDNGAAMKGSTMLATMQWLGVVSSFSRPRTSNDNCYSEALFKTVKYVPDYPEKPFDSVESARAWMASFVHWYNSEHLHSGVNYVTPEARHQGNDVEILLKRHAVYEEAASRTPNRWRRGIRKWQYQTAVCLNPDN
jgi:transposase InsO family protein